MNSIVAAPNWQDWTRQNTLFSHTAIWEDLTFNIAGGSDPEQVPGLRVSSTAFPMLGVGAQLGRTFTAEEDASGHRVVIISDALWRRRFGADPGVVGRITQLNGEAFEIIGVMPPSFAFVQKRYAIWVPIAFTAQDAQTADRIRSTLAARLKPVSRSTRRKLNCRRSPVVSKLSTESTGRELRLLHGWYDLACASFVRRSMRLLGAVGLVLLIACVNVANLLLAQAVVRHREFAIRAALGAGRARLASQLLAEGLLLSVSGWNRWRRAGVARDLGTGVVPPGQSIRFAPFRRCDGRASAIHRFSPSCSRLPR